jgi:putative ABC transport system permease protein
MINHIFRLIWKRKKSSRFLLIEFLGSFLILTIGISFIVFFANNYRQPLGYTYNDKWVISFLPADSINTPEERRFTHRWPEMKEQVKKYLLNVNNIISATDAPKPNRPFISERGWFDVKYNNKIFNDCRVSFVDDDYANVMDVKIIKGRWFS